MARRDDDAIIASVVSDEQEKWKNDAGAVWEQMYGKKKKK
jgi:hypothetical protein